MHVDDYIDQCLSSGDEATVNIGKALDFFRRKASYISYNMDEVPVLYVEHEGCTYRVVHASHNGCIGLSLDLAALPLTRIDSQVMADDHDVTCWELVGCLGSIEVNTIVNNRVDPLEMMKDIVEPPAYYLKFNKQNRGMARTNGC